MVRQRALPSEFEFGKAPTYNSDAGFILAISEDKRAFTATFGGFGVSLDPKSSAPVVARVFSFTLPFSGAATEWELPFFVTGFVICEKGANAHLVFSVNDQTTVADFPGDCDKEFVQELKFKVGSASEIWLTILLWADRDLKSGAEAKLNVNAIDTDAAKHQG